jgi:hypothetical protein
MLKALMAWYVQRFLKKRLDKGERAYSMVLFRYAGENTETLLAGPDTDANLRLIDVFIDQMLHQGHHEVLISLIHTTPEGGVVMGLSWRNRTIQRWFMVGVHEMEVAMKEVKSWCEKERKHE